MAGIEIDGVSNKIELNTGAAAADQHILFNGNAQDFYIALDDSADDLLIGLGSTVGTTPIMLADENRTVTFQSSGIVDNFVIQSTNAGAETAPDLILDRSSASPADNDTAGKVVFRGRNDADESVEYAQITCAMTDVSNGAEDGKLEFDLMTGASSVSYMQFQDAGIVINEGSADIDFRIESNIVEGFLAHEVSDVVPIAVTGEKDAVDDDGNPVYQGIDQSKLVPLMVKTIQELETRIAALEG
jgi:hypothetical protein